MTAESANAPYPNPTPCEVREVQEQLRTLLEAEQELKRLFRKLRTRLAVEKVVLAETASHDQLLDLAALARCTPILAEIFRLVERATAIGRDER